ncbi:type VI secretion protein ImpB [Microvirga sp. W0021]|uniref:DNA-directed DNA polymerase n=1 Tax=Hohaiivirga grylli TaxID=3133970 RepID=A0ABV0BJD9_9HYPH
MRKPETVEHLYIDCDGFFASVEQQMRPRLRERPVGVVPFGDTERTGLIAVSKEAKMLGIKGFMSIREARRICPDIQIVAQSPDLYRRAHNALTMQISSVLPIDVIKSIDELSCRLDSTAIHNPAAVAHEVKKAVSDNIGPYITLTMGAAANRHLAKIACKQAKWHDGVYGDGLAVWKPEDMPGPLLQMDIKDIPGIGPNMRQRLYHANIYSTESLYRTDPKLMRKIWGNVNGERLWYALHGYDIEAEESKQGMIGHSRVLPPENRSLQGSREVARLLAVKAARRLRRANLYASGLWVWLAQRDSNWRHMERMMAVNDDHSILLALERAWRVAAAQLPVGPIFNLGVTLLDFSQANECQEDLFNTDMDERRKWEATTRAIDELNQRYGQTVISLGEWRQPSGGYAGGKISFSRIPDAEDFW